MYTEPYVCTGKFKKDFEELCNKKGVIGTFAPAILPIPQPPVPAVVHHQPQETRPDKSKKDKQGGKEKDKAPVQQEIANNPQDENEESKGTLRK